MTPPRILAVMGLTGAGKSSFVKLVTGNANVVVGHSQKSETEEITGYPATIHGQDFELVDTPGFEDTHKSDTEVLKMLVDWLISTYRAGQKLSGILYLYRIDETRMKGSSLRNLSMFKQLCGNEFYKNLTLGTSCWGIVPYKVAESREKELKDNLAFWKSMLAQGARLERVPEDATAARALVYRIAMHEPIPLQAQKEAVDQNVTFDKLLVTQVVKQELDLEAAHRAQEKKLQELFAEQARRRAELEKQHLLRQIEAAQEAQKQRRQHYASIRQHCSRKTPFGSCDKSGCFNKLKRFRYIYRES